MDIVGEVTCELLLGVTGLKRLEMLSLTTVKCG